MQNKYDNIDITASGEFFVCPISGCIMEEPVTISCGHAFEESCITDWLKKNKKCAFCNKDVDGTVTKNWSMKGFIDSKYGNQIKPSNKIEVPSNNNNPNPYVSNQLNCTKINEIKEKDGNMRLEEDQQAEKVEDYNKLKETGIYDKTLTIVAVSANLAFNSYKGDVEHPYVCIHVDKDIKSGPAHYNGS